MGSDLLDVVRSLTAIMAEEIDRLTVPGGSEDLPALAQAKVRLAGALESELARLHREQPNWAEGLDADEREAVAAELSTLGKVSAANAALLARQIDLSSEMLRAIAAEAKRLSGRRAATYDATGGLASSDLAAPISVNSQY